ncbi:cytochrome c biogenesis protein CcdC [Paenibacillus sp. N1-5-1-14]|uniref:CcdC family protein n=1 Tax=Paenibacillus radicibacter TaxID=2972488 RepID=UPI0021592014|nr:cytochrome c biogenesis protein CcdC [Paenibacillus radicibacter]MCR8642742.1 cytochrome c biogenesis protein CcdC [Paenibacillus radicibacter]
MRGIVIPPHYLSILASLVGGLLVIFLRMRSSDKPTNMRKIIIPPLGMSTGFLMFVVPMMRIPWTWGIVAFLVGAVFFAYPLIRTSKLHVVGLDILLTRSKSFIFIIVGLLAIRLLLHDYIEQYVSIAQTGALFFILAFGMILPWRIAMALEYMKLARTMQSE